MVGVGFGTLGLSGDIKTLTIASQKILPYTPGIDY